jgi:hypothetical protein
MDSDRHDLAPGATAEFCGKSCDHDSPCLLYADHQPADRHETQHGCIFYDAGKLDPVDAPPEDHRRRSMEEGMSGPEALAYLDGAEERGAADLRTRIVEHLEAAGLTKARLIVEGLWDAAAPSAPTTREADVPPAGLRCLSCEVRPATRYARDAEGFGFALCDRCRMDDEAPASAPPAPACSANPDWPCRPEACETGADECPTHPDAAPSPADAKEGTP